MSAADLPEDHGGLAGFRADLRCAVDTIRRRPLVPGVTATLAACVGLGNALPQSPDVATLFWVVGPPAAIVSVGWSGTERLAYLRLWQSGELAGRDLARATVDLVWPVLRLVLLVLLPSATIAAGATLAVVAATGGAVDPLPLALGTGVLVGLALTFALPALVFTTRRARSAVAVGVRLLRRTWPANAWHVVVPLVVFVARGVPGRPAMAPETEVLAAIGLAILGLWFKGAIAAFYLREMGAEHEGVPAFDPRREA